jgi:two-component system cell cycle sensor histidine kinase/response regulator CckA
MVLLWVGVVLISILVHELGHALAFRMYGVPSSIQLCHMGGMTMPEGSPKLTRLRKILFLTANSETADEVLAAYSEGAVDFLVKPLRAEVLRAKVSVFVQLFLQREEIKRLVLREKIADQERELALRARLIAVSNDVGSAFVYGGALPHVLHACAESVVNHLDAALVHIWVLNGQGSLELKASAGLRLSRNGLGTRVQLGEQDVGHIASAARPHLTNAVADDPLLADHLWMKEHGATSFAGFPLLVEGRVMGVVAMFAKSALATSTLEALAAVAKTVAVGLDRLRAIEERSRRLSESERIRDQLCATLQAAQDGVLVVGEAGEVAMHNHRLFETWGTPAHDADGMLANPLLGTFASSLPDGAGFRTLFDRIDQDPTVATETEVVLSDGRSVVVFSVPVRTKLSSGLGRVWFFRDVTTERSAQTMLATANAELEGRVEERTAELMTAERQLRESQKMEAVGRLAGGVAHDFNNMLSVILSVSEVMLEDASLPQAVREDVGDIHAAAERAAGLTAQLLAFSRRQVLEPRAVDLDEMVIEMQRILGRVLGPQIEMRLRLNNAIPAIEADPTQVHQIVLNLVVNARDAMPEGGVPTIETYEVDASDATTGKSGRHVVLRITDTGIGMDGATKDRFFDPFFTTKAHGKGTGLGLATAYGVVRQSGGGIRVETELGKGSTFSVFFPSVDRARTEVEQVSESPPSQLRGRERVVVVDDEPLLRSITARILRANGYTVIEAESPEDALELAMDRTVKLLVTDVMMPRINGIELATTLRNRRPELKVVFMSAFADAAVGSARGTGFFLKPFRAETLLRKARNVLEGRSATPGPTSYR